MNKFVRNPVSSLSALLSFLVCALVMVRPVAFAAELHSARITQIIKDVRLLPGQAAPRPASVSDDVGSGTAVRTGVQSRAELTFTDLTITRLGENTVFSFNEGTRNLNLGSGAILVQVPPKAPAAQISSAAFTCAVTGGTAIAEYNKGAPGKVLILEGGGHFCSSSGECVDISAGEMVTLTPDGHLSKPVKFNAALVYKTSHLITDFPELANAALIFQVIDLQQSDQTGGLSNPQNTNNTLDTTTLRADASPTPASSPAGSPGKFGPPSTITSPDPYVINGTTQIQTDPSITTNGATNFGTIYRSEAQDGTVPQFIYGSTQPFDTFVFEGGPSQDGPYAAFKFSSLQLVGNPTISTINGGATNLALVSVGDITSGAPGGTLTFAGMQNVFIGTQSGSINLGPEISFSGLSKLIFYARGTGSALTIASPISSVDKVKFYAEGTIQVNGDVSTTDFKAISSGDFLAGSGLINAASIDIESLANINIDGSQFPNPTGDVNFNAADALNIMLTGGGMVHFSGTSLTGQGTTINLQGSVNPTTFDLETATVSFTAGSGGIQAPNIFFTNGSSLLLQTTNGGDINIYGTQNGMADSPGGDSIMADGAFTAQSDVSADGVHAGTSINVGGSLLAGDFQGVSAGTTINVGGVLSSKEVSAGGNVTANQVEILTLNAPNGVLTAGSGGITPFLFADANTSYDANRQHTFTVDSIVSPSGIDFSGNQFGGLNDLSNGGKLTINATTLTFESEGGVAFANFNGADAGAFGAGSPPDGGDGGVFIVNTTGNITANSGANITATTGINSDAGVYSGAGGSVTLHSTGGMVTVNDRIEVSSDDIEGQQQSASGGTILLRSDLTTGPGITVGANAQLLSLLNTSAIGPGGSITLSTMGADITVNGWIEADRGTITIDQTDPVVPTPPLITIDGATLMSDALNVHSAGNLNIAETSGTTLTFSTATLHADGSVNLNVQNTSLLESIDSLDVTAGSTINTPGAAINLTGGTSDVSAVLTLNLTTASTFRAGTGGINAQFVDIDYAGAELHLVSGADITAHSITFTDFNARGSVNAAGSIIITNDLFEGIITAAAGEIDVGGNISSGNLTAGTTVTAGGYISTGTITAGGDIMANTTHVEIIDSPTGVLRVANGISPLVFSTSPGFPQGAGAPHVYTVSSIVSPAGIDFSGNQFGGIADLSSGGLLTINADTITFDPGTGIGNVNFNGADAGGFNGVTPTVGGDGGTFIVNAANNISTTANSPISATTGLIDPNLSEAFTAGAGGTVELNSTNGTVSVDSRIEVSSDDPIPEDSPPPPVRRSSSGGNIALTSGKASGVAISVSSSSQLLALLDGFAPGPGGTITVRATGASSEVHLNGQVYADRGTILVQHDGDNGQIFLGQTGVNVLDMRGDVVKVGALGLNGMLSIGQGTISADTLLKLYAGGSNGTITFTDDVTLSGAGTKIIAAHIVSILDGKTVTIGGTSAALVYTNHPNYASLDANLQPTGGNDSTTGRFAGAGATTDVLANAPVFGAAARRSAPTTGPRSH